MGLEAFTDCLPTARFLKIFNDAFDILNSRNNYIKGLKKSISKENSLEVLKKVDEIQNYISNLKTVKNIPIVKTQSQTGFIAFYVGLEIVKLIYTDLIANNQISSYETYCACQDHLEIFLALYDREMVGVLIHLYYNSNPPSNLWSFTHKRNMQIMETARR